MFTKQSAPFKLFYYHKNIKDNELRTELMLAYNCVFYPYVKMAVCIFEENQIQVLRRDRYGQITIDGIAQEAEDKMMKLSNFIDNFRASEGLDFVILAIPVYFLITRQKENKIKIYMTNASAYLEVFADPNKCFDVDDDIVNNYLENFDLEYLGVRKLEADDESPTVDSKKMMDTLDDAHGRDDLSLEEGMNSLCIDSSTKGPAGKEDLASTKDLAGKEDPRSKETEESNDRTDKSSKMKEKNKSSETFMIEVGNPVDDKIFDKHIKENRIRSVITLGKMSGEGYEFERYPLKENSNDFLMRIVERFPSGIYDFIEIIGKTKIAGCIKDDKVIWYGELTDQIEDISEYIKLMNSIFKYTVEFDRDDSKSSNSEEGSDEKEKDLDSHQSTASSE